LGQDGGPRITLAGSEGRGRTGLLPPYRVTDDAFPSPASTVLDEPENRPHTITIAPVATSEE